MEVQTKENHSKMMEMVRIRTEKMDIKCPQGSYLPSHPLLGEGLVYQKKGKRH